MNPIKVLLACTHADGERARKAYPELDGYRMATSDGRLMVLRGVTINEVYVTKSAPNGMHYKEVVNALMSVMTTKERRIRYE